MNRRLTECSCNIRAFMVNHGVSPELAEAVIAAIDATRDLHRVGGTELDYGPALAHMLAEETLIGSKLKPADRERLTFEHDLMRRYIASEKASGQLHPDLGPLWDRHGQWEQFLALNAGGG